MPDRLALLVSKVVAASKEPLMFIVYCLATGELVYTADAEATEHLDVERYGFAEVQPGWQQTHQWNQTTRELEELPAE